MKTIAVGLGMLCAMMLLWLAVIGIISMLTGIPQRLT